MIKRNIYHFRNNNFIKFRIGIVIISIIVTISLIKVFPHFLRNTYIVTITNKRIVKSNNSEKYLIYAQTADGKIKIFQDNNSLLELKFLSRDIYWGLAVYKKYEVRAYGFDIPLLSRYQNIIKVKGIEK